MRRIFLVFTLAVATAAMIVACKKGDPGPAGAQGPAGPTGPTGATGPIGTANVIYSTWAGFQTADWKKDSATNLGYFLKAERNVTAITQAVLDQGLVLGFLRITGTKPEGPYQLPTVLNPLGSQVNIGIRPIVGKAVFFNQDLTQRYYGYTFDASYEFRYVIIPGGVSGRNVTQVYNGYTAEQLKAMPYEEVIKVFGIPAEGTNQ